MQNYSSNAHNSKGEKPEEKKEEERPKIVPVANARRRKKPFSRRMADVFVADDSKSVMGYLIQDVVVPSIKEMVTAAVSQGIERMLFGEARGRTIGRPGSVSSPTNYNRYSTRPVNEPRTISQRSRATHDFDEIILDTRHEANEVLDSMGNLISTYGVVTVSDLYSLVGVNSSYTDNKYGWLDLAGAQIVQVRGGYLLDIRKPEVLD